MPLHGVSIPFKRESPFRLVVGNDLHFTKDIMFQFPSNGKALSDFRVILAVAVVLVRKFQFPSNGKALSDTNPSRGLPA